jgi:hypothetical protein
MIMWQDIVLTIISVAFGYSLIPQVIYGFRNRVGFITYQTGIITTIGLLLASIVNFTLNLYLSAITTSITAICWAFLLYQRVKYGKRKNG